MNEWKTAIARKKPSAPVRKLLDAGRVTGRVLDYGCGRGFDAVHLGAESYDPHFQPNMPEGQFDTIVCNFVLNVIESAETRQEVIDDIRSRLRPDGRAFISIRTDRANLNGRTKLGTWQGLVEVPGHVVSRGSGFSTYELGAA